ncbi:hypothetical protein K461DRAFT_40233 [Myriangium duriaei CBS 260.36]|uniref:Uncharacterized protein n=1 Tax=Myriangium duriaei CBS 260.36 TaxID=1168546 RepID=A0A9P4MEF5_9PEZI|nr:hypothetical protein K461DRAFT_40233 [Myriangium duriaei CBS 260.36]
MAGVNDKLAAEIERIVTCPYPTQLQTFREILNTCDPLDVEIWAANHAEQIPPLLTAVLAALPHWSYCIDIITGLATCQQLRNAILAANPSILVATIDQAIAEFGIDSGAVKAACGLLSSPLSPEHPLPANAQTLLLRLFEAAAKRPNAQLLHHINALLWGGCNSIIRIVPATILHGFGKHVFKILRQASDAEQQSLGLCCLSIMSALIDAIDCRADGQSWDRTAMDSFFRGNKAVKTVQLAVLQTVWFCSEGCNANISNLTRDISVTVKVLSAISSESKVEWCRDNDRILQKLFHKITAKETQEQLKLMAYSIVSTLVPSDTKLPNQVLQAVERLVLNVRHFRISSTYLDQFLRNSFPFFASQLTHGFLSDYLKSSEEVLSAADRCSLDEMSRIAKVASAISAGVASFGEQQLTQSYTNDGAALRSLVEVIERVIKKHRSFCKASPITVMQAARLELSAALRNLLLGVLLQGARHGMHCPVELTQTLLGVQTVIQTPLPSLPRQRFERLGLDHHGDGHVLLSEDHTLPWQESLERALKARAQIGKEAHEQEICRLQAKLQESTAIQANLVQELEMQKHECKEACRKAEGLNSDLKGLRGLFKTEKEAFLAEYQNTAAQAQAEWEVIRRDLEQRVSSLEIQQQHTEHSHQEASLAAEEKSRQQHRQIVKLKKECAAKDAQLTSAQDMRNRLMSAMGIANAAPEPEVPQSTLPIRSASSAETPKANTLRASAMEQEFESEMMDDSFASADLDRTEPTPKRTRPRRAFRVPSLHQPREASSRRAVRSSYSTSIIGGRVPLSEASVNLSPVRKTPGKVTFKDVHKEVTLEGIGLGEEMDGDTTVDM